MASEKKPEPKSNTEDSKAKKNSNDEEWTFCGCCARREPSTFNPSETSLNLNEEYDIVVEKLVLHRVPLALAGTKEDVLERIDEKEHSKAQPEPEEDTPQTRSAMPPGEPAPKPTASERAPCHTPFYDDIPTYQTSPILLAQSGQKRKSFNKSTSTYDLGIPAKDPGLDLRYDQRQAPPARSSNPGSTRVRFHGGDECCSDDCCDEVCDDQLIRNRSVECNELVYERGDTPLYTTVVEKARPPKNKRHVNKALNGEELNLVNFVPQINHTNCPSGDALNPILEKSRACRYTIDESKDPNRRRTCSRTPEYVTNHAKLYTNRRPTRCSEHEMAMGKLYYRRPKETRFKPEHEERTYEVNRSKEENTRKSELLMSNRQRPDEANNKDGRSQNEKQSKDRTKSTSKQSNEPETSHQNQRRNEAGPSSMDQPPTPTHGILRQPQQETSSSSLVSILAKPSIKSIKSTSFAVNRDILDEENKPITTEERQPGKPLYVNVSGKNLTKEETHQILNKYSSIFLDNIKDPIPKDPLSFRRHSEEQSELPPGVLTRNPDLATKLSEIGSTQFGQMPNSVYASPTHRQRPISRTQSIESIVEKVHQYDVESTTSKQSDEDLRRGKRSSNIRRLARPKTPGSTSPKPGPSKPEPFKRIPTKYEAPKRDTSKPEKQEPQNPKSTKKPENPRSQTPRSGGHSSRAPIYEARRVELSYLDSEKLNLIREKHRSTSKPTYGRGPPPSTITFDEMSAVETNDISKSTLIDTPQNSIAGPSSERHERPCSETYSASTRYQIPVKQTSASQSGRAHDITPTHSLASRRCGNREEKRRLMLDACLMPPVGSNEGNSKERKKWKIIIRHQKDSSTDNSFDNEKQ